MRLDLETRALIGRLAIVGLLSAGPSRSPAIGLELAEDCSAAVTRVITRRSAPRTGS